MRFVLRILSFAALAAAVIVATIDAVRFVATGILDLAPLTAVLARVGVDPAFVGAAVDGLPAAAVLLALSLLLWMAGYRRPKPFRPFAAADAP